VLGAATVISTGLTNNPLFDSFFIPLVLALIGLWMYKQGMFTNVTRWLDKTKANATNAKLERKINQIRNKRG
jgi:hypothetical protein